MKTVLQNLLWLLALIACALSHLPVAAARLRSAGQFQGPNCPANLQIESVTYLGRNNGKDSVKVVFSGHAPTPSNLNGTNPGFNNTSGVTCAKYGVPPVNNVQGNLTTPSFQPGFSNSQNFGYELTVTITRKFGNKDTGTAKSSNIFIGSVTTIVQIPRATLETDPVAYDVTIKTTFGGQLRRTLTAQGNGAPALAAATQTFANSSLVQMIDTCFPSVSISGLSFTPGSGATPDNVTIDWTANRAPTDCFFGPKVFISVDVKRPDGSTGRASIQPNANSITMNLSGAPAAPVSFIVRVSAETSLGRQIQVTRKGDF